MNMFKKNGGFTLVELIVVIAILAILAGVAIPAYSGYINKANDAAAIVELDAISTAAQAANATKGAISKINVNAAGTEITVTADAFSNTYDADFVMFYPDATAGTDSDGTQVFNLTNALTSNWTTGSYKNGATWTVANGWEAGIK